MVKNYIITDENGSHWEVNIPDEDKAKFIGQIHYFEPENVFIYFEEGDQSTQEWIDYQNVLVQTKQADDDAKNNTEVPLTDEQLIASFKRLKELGIIS